MGRIAPTSVTTPSRAWSKKVLKGLIIAGILLLPATFLLWGVVSLLTPSTTTTSSGVAANAPSQNPKVVYPTIAGQGGWSSIMGEYPECNVPRQPKTLDTTLFRFNPDGKCATALWPAPGSCLMFKQAKTDTEVGPYGYCPESKGLAGPADAEYIRNYKPGSIQIEYRLTQPTPDLSNLIRIR